MWWGGLNVQGSDSGPFGTGCVNTISKEMGPFSALCEWNEWIHFHSKWVSHLPAGHSIWVSFALNSIQNGPYFPHLIWVGSYVSHFQDVFLGPHCPIGHVTN